MLDRLAPVEPVPDEGVPVELVPVEPEFPDWYRGGPGTTQLLSRLSYTLKPKICESDWL